MYQNDKEKSQNKILSHFEIMLYLSNFRYKVALDIPKALATKSLSFYSPYIYLRLLLSLFFLVHPKFLYLQSPSILDFWLLLYFAW